MPAVQLELGAQPDMPIRIGIPLLPVDYTQATPMAPSPGEDLRQPNLCHVCRVYSGTNTVSSVA